MKIPLLSGVYAAAGADFAISYPVNLEPVALDTSIAKGYLRAAMGAVRIATGPGVDRGGIDWDGRHYRAMGTRLVRIDPDDSIADLGEIGDGGQVHFDYSPDRLIVNSGDRLYYYDRTDVRQVTDIDLGKVIDAIFVDGYTMTTDGTYILVAELSDPYSVKPLKYGTAEADPDPIVGLIVLRDSGEVYALGRYTIQVFGNVGGTGFPFAVRRGAGVNIGCVGTDAKCLFGDTFAFVGSRRGEAAGVYIAGQGSGRKVSDRAIDDALASVPDQSVIVLEARSSRDEQRLYVHLPTTTWVYLASASARVGAPVWYEARSGVDGPYRIRSAILSGGRWICGDRDSAAVGVTSEATFAHFGQATGWRFETGLLYNDARGGIIHDLELIGLPGRVPFGGTSTAFLSFSREGRTWSTEKAVNTGRAGERIKRPAWRPHRRFHNWVGLRFRGYDSALPGWTALEARIVPLAV